MIYVVSRRLLLSLAILVAVLCVGGYISDDFPDRIIYHAGCAGFG